tara:strand:+ start:1 stop:1416 length:1416 start_codon:yes stop_codon:yes gene_type:complete
MLFVDGGDNRVGIKSAPDLGGALHVKVSDSGGSVNGNYDTLVIEESGHSGIAILSGTSSAGLIGFGDSGAALRGYFSYNHSNDSFEFGTAGAERMRIDGSGLIGMGNTTASSFNSGANKLVVGSGSGNNGLTIYAATNASSSIYFADGTSGDAAYRGYIQYNHSSDAMVIATSAAQVASFHTDGIVFNENSNDQNFRIESNDKTHMFFVDAGDNRAGFVTAPDLGHVHIRVGDSGASVSQFDALVIEEDDNCGITLLSGTTGAGRLVFGDSGDNDVGAIGYEHGANAMIFVTNATERMRINSSGDLFVAKTSSSYGTTGHEFLAGGLASHSRGQNPCLLLNRSTSEGTTQLFRYNNSDVGSISVTSSSTAFNTSSDYRLKENISYDFDATSRLKQLKPSRFNFIADADKTVDGFLAHEVSDIVPEAITGEKDAVDSDGNPEYQGIDQSKLVPLLVKTIQELEARITTLENN